MIAQILSVWMAGAAPSGYHSVADMICPAGAISCVVLVPDWTYRVQAPSGEGSAWAAFTRSGDALPWRSRQEPRPSMDSLLLPISVTESDSGWTWDLHARFPVVGAFVAFDKAGASGEVVVEARNQVDRNWRYVGGQPCWNVLRDGKTIRQDTLRWPGEQRLRFWRVRPVGSRATLGGAPRLVLLMRRDRVEIATGGADSLVWAAGAGVERASETPEYPQTIPVAPAQGRIGEARLASGEKAWVVSVSTRTWVLWVCLVAFLCGLGILAAKLLRQAFASKDKSAPFE